MAEARKNPELEEDEELDQLLDSTVQEFALPPPPDQERAAVPAPSEPGQSGQPLWDEAFVSQATAQFTDAMKSLLNNDPELTEEFQKWASEAGRSAASATTEQEFAESLAKTLKGLAENAEALQNPLSDQDLSQLLDNMGIHTEGDLTGDDASGEDDAPTLLPFMKTVMQSLLSKDLLYPAMKEITDKYPEWLADNCSQLSADQFEKYNRQYELMKQTCDEFEAEKDTDPADVKQARFDRLLELMNKMQACGHPPKELIGEATMDFGVDADGNMKLPGFPPFSPNSGGESCSIM